MPISQPIAILRIRRSQTRLQALAMRIARSLREFLVAHAIGA